MFYDNIVSYECAVTNTGTCAAQFYKNRVSVLVSNDYKSAIMKKVILILSISEVSSDFISFMFKFKGKVCWITLKEIHRVFLARYKSHHTTSDKWDFCGIF